MRMTKADIDYIEYFMWRHEGQMSAQEIADTLGIKRVVVYNIAKEHHIATRKKKRVEQDCKNRPHCCFTCTASDCFCRDNMNAAEKALWDYGKSDKERW